MTDWNCENNGLEPPTDAAAAVRDEQVQRALRRLDDCGGLTPRQRATVERLAGRLTVKLLALFDTDERATDADDDKAACGILLCPE